MLFGTPSEGYMQQTVYTNPKCDSCVWYDRQGGKHGLCEKGLQPVICGDGMHPEMGFWPLSGAGHHNLPLLPITPPVGTGPGTEGLPEAVHLEAAIAKYDKVVKGFVEKQAALIRSGCRPHSNYSGMSVGNTQNFVVTCTCEKIKLYPIAKSLYEMLSNKLRAAVEDEEQLQEFVFKAMQRVYASPSASSTPPAYLPGVHSPDSPVRPGKKKEKKLVKGFADLDKSIGTPSDPIVAKYHQSHDKVLEAAKQAHASGAGLHGADPASYKLRLAAKEHGLVGQQFNDHPGHEAAAQFHYDRAAKYSAGKHKEKDAHRALAAQAIAHYHENQITRALGDSDIAKSALTDAAKQMVKLGVDQHDPTAKAAQKFREHVANHVEAASKHKDFPGYAQAYAHHSSQAYKYADSDPAMHNVHVAIASAFKHRVGSKKSLSEEGLEKSNTQPQMPDTLKAPAKALHALKPQKITIASDHPAAMALRSAAKNHVASTFRHFGTDDHARHSAAHREMAMASKDSPDQAAHDALAAAHVTYGKTKNHPTYKQKDR